jgi:adenylate cyclase
LSPVAGEAYVNLYGRDVTEERRAHQQVIDVKNFNQSILENLSNGIITFDDRLVVTSANPAVRSILQSDEGELVRRTATEIFGQRNAWLVEHLERVLASQEPFVLLEQELEMQKGEHASVNITIVAMLSIDDRRPGCMLVLDDITREKRIKGTMVRFMSDSVVERLLEADESVLGGNSQEVAILFSDIREFTKLSEKLGAREMVSVLNDYFAKMVDIIFEHDGTLDKFIGDAIMAVFGAPFVSPNDADNAVEAAIEMLVRLRDFNVELVASGRQEIDIGVGIDTGPVVAGTIGSPKRMDYTVIGDHVNLASRIEAANKYYGTQILISEHTLERLHQPVRTRELDHVRVLGRARPVTIYEVMDHHTEATFPNMDAVLGAFEKGLAHYRRREWQRGAEYFTQALQGNHHDRPTQIYLDRCWSYATRPPGESWNGITDMGAK